MRVLHRAVRLESVAVREENHLQPKSKQAFEFAVTYLMTIAIVGAIVLTFGQINPLGIPLFDSLFVIRIAGQSIVVSRAMIRKNRADEKLQSQQTIVGDPDNRSPD